MDKAILKKFAIESRQDLMQKIESKIKLFYVDETFSKQQNGDVYVLSNEKHTLSLSKEEYDKRELLIKRIQELGLEQVIEEAAYTWFNRVVAIRYMEINDYLPLTKDNQSLGIRVLSSKDNTPDPEIMKFTNLINPELDIDFKKEKYAELKDDNDKFKYVLLLVCKKLGKVIPQVFDGVTDYIDILIPDNLLNDTGFINKIVTEVPENNYNQVEIIGWLYQYYNQIEKDRVISSKKAYKKNEIAYATQLFTPDWIVKYMVENSLGKYWIEHSNSDSIIDNWKYFIKDNIEKYNNKVNPTEITFIDPCCGSGHILVYAFEVFHQIYESVGYNKNDIPELILENNLYGLDIDDRAGQLSILSILLKAREYDKNIFNKVITKNLNVLSIQESNSMSNSILENISNDIEKENAKYILDSFKNAKEVGSLLRLENKNYSELEKIINEDNTIFGLEMNRLLPLIKIARILSIKYDVVVTNPPYMNHSYMPNTLKKYIINNFEDYKSDLFSAFVANYSTKIKENGFMGFMTPYVWMFIQSYEKLREYILNKMNIDSLIQLEYSALEEATVPICSFILKNNLKQLNGIFFRLTDFVGGMNIQESKFMEIKETNKYIIAPKEKYCDIPGKIIGYWVDNNIIKSFKNGRLLGDISCPRQGLATTNNNLFLRNWFEVNNNLLFRNCENANVSKNSDLKWYPYNKGGYYRKWYGNCDFVINWWNNGFDVKEYIKNKNPNVARGEKFYFKESISWSKISSGAISFRYFPKGYIFDVAGCSIFFDNKEMFDYIFAFLNSKVSLNILQCLSPTLNYEAGQIQILPILYSTQEIDKIKCIVENNVEISKQDWDLFETSWDFLSHPLLLEHNLTPQQIKKEEENGFLVENTLEEAYKHWEISCNERFNKLKENEEELNRIFIEIYGLQDELTPNVEDKDITIRKANKEREIKSLISYAVGCMFGRYSLDENGLIYAGGEFDIDRYKFYKPDIDNIIPITDESYFGDDIVERFKDFIRTVYGRETFNENLDFIAEALGKRGTETSEETIRRYFNNDFYSDHIKMYQKKPIYWLFDSGKKNGFKALIYMHRYNENTVPKVRLDYLHRIQTTYEKLLSDVNYKLTTELSMNEKKEIQKRQTDLNAKLQEIKEYDEKIAHIANQRISIDLDDGVTVNYDKFKDILAKIK